MAAPAAMRPPLLALYALNAELARAPWAASEPLLAEMRIQWWRDALADVAAGRPRDDHPALVLLSRMPALPADRLDTLAAARRRDIDPEPFADLDALMVHLAETAGNLLALAALATGRPGAVATAEAAGIGQGAANWLLALPAYAARGRRPLPAGMAPAEAVAAIAGEGLSSLVRARGLGAAGAAPVLRAAWRAQPILSAARRRPRAALEGTLGGSEFARRGRLLLKALTGGW
ncbi:MAG: phytoene synthase [Alphaproteobacteria bacterium]|nr:MAG: phytoene synthase [Alphaproteobacteria bacterium]